MTMVPASLNEPEWLTAARAASVPIADADIPPPGEGADFVSKVLNYVGKSAPATLGELAMWGTPIDTAKKVPPIGSLVFINQPKMWVPVNPNSAAAQLPNNARSHVGFLVRQTQGMVYVLGEAVVRSFPKKAVGAYRSVP